MIRIIHQSGLRCPAKRESQPLPRPTFHGAHNPVRTMSKDVVICSPVRSAIGSFGGSLKDTPTSALGAHAIAATLRRSGLDPTLVDSVVMGNVVQAGNGMNIARQAAIHGGLPVAAPAMTVEPGVRVWRSSRGHRLCRDRRGAVADGHCGRRREHGPCTLLAARHALRRPHGQRRSGGFAAARRLARCLLHKHSGWHTEDLAHKHESHARGAGCVRSPKPAALRRRSSGRMVQGRDRAACP